VLITDVGFEFRQILPVLCSAITFPRGPSSCWNNRRFTCTFGAIRPGGLFIDAVKNRNIQIILESHSEHLLRRLQRRIAEEKLEPKDTALYFCEIDKGGRR